MELTHRIWRAHLASDWEYAEKLSKGFCSCPHMPIPVLMTVAALSPGIVFICLFPGLVLVVVPHHWSIPSTMSSSSLPSSSLSSSVRGGQPVASVASGPVVDGGFLIVFFLHDVHVIAHRPSSSPPIQYRRHTMSCIEPFNLLTKTGFSCWS